MGNFWKIFKPTTEKRKLDYINPGWGDALLFGSNGANSSSMSISAVNRAVSIISDSIAIMPVKVKDTRLEHVQELHNHPVKRAFTNPIITEYTLKNSLIRDVLLKGNGYAYINRAKDGTVLELIYLPADTVTCTYNEKTYDLYYTCTNLNELSRIDPADMIHLKKYTRNGVEGVSVLTYALRAIKIAQATEQQAQDFFDSGCNLQGVLTVEGVVSSKQREDIRKSWDTCHGPNATGIAILPGNMSYQSISTNASDAQLLESRKFNVEDIARFFGIPAVLLTGEQTSNLEACQNQFLLHCLTGYIEMFEQEFTNKLFPDSDLVIQLDTTALLKTDKTALANYYNTLITNGVLCPNEVRKELGYAAVDGLDKHVIAYTDINQNTINKEENQTQQK